MDEPLLPAHRVPHDLLFRRLGPLVAKGLQLPDLWRLEVDVPQADALLQEKLRRPRPAPELQECGRRAPWTASWDRLPALVQKLCLAYWPDMLPASLFKLAADLLRYVSAYLLSRLLDAMETHEAPITAFLLAWLLPLATLAQAVLVNQYFWHSLRLGAIVRGAMAAALFRRTLGDPMVETD
ncbi:unnamed protein product [Durusdinium trenchii]|uniref:ABC transmembrane type-1 domain-containing protein n=1 Tax=Durusdinium trenchii TaxID=1381693 RepID=A0ABP0K2S9_9DINO